MGAACWARRQLNVTPKVRAQPGEVMVLERVEVRPFDVETCSAWTALLLSSLRLKRCVRQNRERERNAGTPLGHDEVTRGALHQPRVLLEDGPVVFRQ